jgi:hypothetical protein
MTFITRPRWFFGETSWERGYEGVKYNSNIRFCKQKKNEG